MANNPAAAIKTLLHAESTLTDIVGQSIYPNIMPETATYPAVVFGQVSQEILRTKDGPVPGGKYTYEVNIYSLEYQEAQAIAAAVEIALVWQMGTFGGVVVEFIDKTDQQDAVYQEEKELYQIVQDYTVSVSD